MEKRWFVLYASENLLEIEISDCNCINEDSLPFGKFNKLKDFIESCKKCFKGKEEKFLQPVMRRNTFSLKDLAKSCVRNQTNSYDELELPEGLKAQINQEKLDEHCHFRMALNEIEDKNSFVYGKNYHFTSQTLFPQTF